MNLGQVELGKVIVQNKFGDNYETARYQEALNEEDTQQEEDIFDNVSVFEARWLLICLVAVAPLWIWPFDFPQIFAQFGVSIIKAIGWIVGLATVVFVSSILFSSIGKALLKASHPHRETAAGTSSHR